jgi:hypothetical protein
MLRYLLETLAWSTLLAGTAFIKLRVRARLVPPHTPT